MRRKQIPAPELQRVDSDSAGDHVHLRFRGKAGLRAAESPKRTAWNAVGAHRRSDGGDCLPPVRTCDPIPGLDGGADAGIAVRTAVKPDVALPCDQYPIS